VKRREFFGWMAGVAAVIAAPVEAMRNARSRRSAELMAKSMDSIVRSGKVGSYYGFTHYPHPNERRIIEAATGDSVWTEPTKLTMTMQSAEEYLDPAEVYGKSPSHDALETARRVGRDTDRLIIEAANGGGKSNSAMHLTVEKIVKARDILNANEGKSDYWYFDGVVHKL
jgi:hypothetical protein